MVIHDDKDRGTRRRSNALSIPFVSVWGMQEAGYHTISLLIERDNESNDCIWLVFSENNNEDPMPWCIFEDWMSRQLLIPLRVVWFEIDSEESVVARRDRVGVSWWDSHGAFWFPFEDTPNDHTPFWVNIGVGVRCMRRMLFRWLFMFDMLIVDE